VIQRLRRKATHCKREDKAIFVSREAALMQIRRLNQAGYEYAAELRPYRCVTHRGFHLGRLPW